MWVSPSGSTSRNRPDWTAQALSCRRKLIQEGGFDTRIFFWVVVLSILLRLVLLLPRHSYLGNRYWLGWGMGGAKGRGVGLWVSAGVQLQVRGGPCHALCGYWVDAGWVRRPRQGLRIQPGWASLAVESDCRKVVVA